MKLIRSMCIAFSLYSRIPSPQLEWRDEDMRYVLIFFPWVGVVIGGLFVGWYYLCQSFGIGQLAFVLIGTAIPLVVAGGFHVDGFMDTMDALNSYGDKKKRLEILLDSHIGAFSVIMLALCGIIFAAGLSEICTPAGVYIAAMGFVFSRTLSGIGIITLKSAGQDDSLKPVADKVSKNVVLITLIAEGILCVAGMIMCSLYIGLLAISGAVLSFFWYRYMAYKYFGGITGDLAGYFVVVCETVNMLTAAVGSRLWG